MLTQAYSVPGDRPQRLTAGNFAVVTTAGSTFSGRQAFGDAVTVAAPGGFVQAVFRAPPAPPFLVIAFAKSNDPTTLVINISADVFFVGGKFEFAKFPVRRIARRRVLDLVQRFPQVGERWDTLIDAASTACNRRKPARWRAAAKRAHAAIVADVPGLANVTLPLRFSGEHFGLRAIAGTK